MIDGIEFMAGRVHLGYERILDSGKSGLRLEAEIPLNDSRNHCERFYILDVSSSCFYATPKWMFFTGFNLDEEAFFPKWAGTFRWNYYYRNEEAVKNYLSIFLRGGESNVWFDKSQQREYQSYRVRKYTIAPFLGIGAGIGAEFKIGERFSFLCDWGLGYHRILWGKNEPGFERQQWGLSWVVSADLSYHFGK